MAEPRSDSLLRSRQEAALLLRLDPQNLSASDALRCDLIATLRLSIDSAQADALEGRAADLGRLIVATESLVKLLPSEPPKPASSSPSPQEIMWQTYLGMRRRGDLAGDENSFDFQRRRRLELEAEVKQLKAQLAEALGAPAPGEPSAPAIPHAGAPPDNVVKLRDNPGRSCAAPAELEEYETVVVTEAVLGQPEAWRNFIGSDGSIVTPGRKDWGPVGS
jgi:hypothetical protein